MSGRVITASIRTVSGNVTSEPMVKKITCGMHYITNIKRCKLLASASIKYLTFVQNQLTGDAEGYAILHCRNLLLYWAVRITPIENYTKLMIEFPDFPM